MGITERQVRKSARAVWSVISGGLGSGKDGPKSEGPGAAAESVQGDPQAGWAYRGGMSGPKLGPQGLDLYTQWKIPLPPAF